MKYGYERELIDYLKQRKEEFEEESNDIQKKCSNSLLDKECEKVICDGINLQIIKSIIRIIDDLIEKIELDSITIKYSENEELDNGKL